MKVTKSDIQKIILEEISMTFESGTQGYIDELDNLLGDMTMLRTSLRKGPNRMTYRKERSRLQAAIEAVRYLKRRSKRQLDRNLLVTD